MNLRHGLTMYRQLQSGLFDAAIFSAIRLNKYRSQQLHTFNPLALELDICSLARHLCKM
jgi:hypothetical protein